jgi:hypothetical protein
LDNPTPESSLNADAAADAISNLFNPVEEDPDRKLIEALEPDATAEPELTAEAEESDDPTVTVKIDGKEVEVSLSELKSSYQKDKVSTERFMQAAETRKQAEAEIARTQHERQTYIQNLQRLQVQDEAALAQQQNIDWSALLKSDPVEYLEQQRLASERQARLNQVYTEQQRIAAQLEAEGQSQRANYLQQQQEELLAKLPAWKDTAKASAEKAALRDYLLQAGYDGETVGQLADAKAVVIARKAMLYDQMVAKASAATKKVSTLPTRVERPGVGESPQMDRRSNAFQKLSKSGRAEDAAALFASIL